MKNENMKKNSKLIYILAKKKQSLIPPKALQDWVFQIGVHWLFNEIMKIVQP